MYEFMKDGLKGSSFVMGDDLWLLVSQRFEQLCRYNIQQKELDKKFCTKVPRLLLNICYLCHKRYNLVIIFKT